MCSAQKKLYRHPIPYELTLVYLRRHGRDRQLFLACEPSSPVVVVVMANGRRPCALYIHPHGRRHRRDADEQALW